MRRRWLLGRFAKKTSLSWLKDFSFDPCTRTLLTQPCTLTSFIKTATYNFCLCSLEVACQVSANIGHLKI